jgi:hypothetical protein
MSRFLPIFLIVGGALAAGAYAYLSIFEHNHRPIQFAIACLVAAIGFHELSTTNEHIKSFGNE